MKMIVDDVDTTTVHFDVDEGLLLRVGGVYVLSDHLANAYTIRASDYHEDITEAEAEDSSIGLGTYPPSLMFASDIGTNDHD
jgi:hypothetical protein